MGPTLSKLTELKVLNIDLLKNEKIYGPAFDNLCLGISKLVYLEALYLDLGQNHLKF